MIFTRGNKSYCLAPETGEELWEVKNSIHYVDPVDNIGIGYKMKGLEPYSNELEGIDLKTGDILWSRVVNREYGWNDLFYTNDSTLIIVAAGLHAINIGDGNGWDYNTITGKKDYTATAVANGAGVALGILTGTFVMSTGHDLVRDVVSNSIVDSSYIYFASKEQLAKINKQNGEVLWEYPFPDDFASRSSIFVNDTLLYLINYGFAYMGNRQMGFGKPCIAAFDKNTGSQQYLSLMETKKNPILAFHLLDDELYLVFKDKIAKHSLETGSKIIEKEFPQDNYGGLKYFTGDQVFETKDDVNLVSLSQSDSTKVFVFTDNGKILSIDKQLNVVDQYDYEDLGLCSLRKNNYKFVLKDKQTLIINGDGKTVARIEATTPNASLFGNILYDTQENSFIAIDLTGVIGGE